MQKLQHFSLSVFSTCHKFTWHYSDPAIPPYLPHVSDRVQEDKTSAPFLSVTDECGMKKQEVKASHDCPLLPQIQTPQSIHKVVKSPEYLSVSCFCMFLLSLYDS